MYVCTYVHTVSTYLVEMLQLFPSVVDAEFVCIPIRVPCITCCTLAEKDTSSDVLVVNCFGSVKFWLMCNKCHRETLTGHSGLTYMYACSVVMLCVCTLLSS